uniref:hypothetical protein n=1 Tax=Castellaniella defragrans TaxID=75697 RepID=UPI00333EF0E7
MSRIRAQREPTATPEKMAVGGRVFRFSLKGLSVVDATMEARLKTAARTPRRDRRYPVMIESPGN